MKGTEPIIDDRDQEEIYETLRQRARTYTETWDPDTGDVGQTLVRIFSSFEADVRNRLNEVPEKHLLAFLDALDFDRRPPQAARVPLSFDVSRDLDRNVPIPGGTTAIADPTDGETQQFELPQEAGFEATPASLTDVVAVDPTADAIVDHDSLLESEQMRLFDGEPIQSHVLYLENESALNVAAGSTFTVRVDSQSDPEPIFEETIWEYYGENEDGEDGWHRLERVVDDTPQSDDGGVKALQEQLQANSSTAAGDSRSRDGVAEQRFRLPGESTLHEVNGTEGRWLRCSLRDGAAVPTWTVRSISIQVTSNDRETDAETGLDPDMLLSNDVPVALDDERLHPFGRVPHPPVTFFVACEEAFTKPGGTVELEFTPPAESESESANPQDSSSSATGGRDGDNGAGMTESDAMADALPHLDEETNVSRGVLDGPPEVSWEYWNGSGWTRLDSVADGTETLRHPGRVQFEVPSDIEPTTVAGHDNVWIRARLVSGTYDQPSIEDSDGPLSTSFTTTPDPPVYGDVIVEYEHLDLSFNTIVRQNNGAYSDDLTKREWGFDPFVSLPDDAQTVYLGFDRRLENGPISLFFVIDDATHPQQFDPGVQWEYRTVDNGPTWNQIDVRDQTAGLTERGIVMLTFPTPTTETELFGRHRHWIRARLTKDEFTTEFNGDAETVAFRSGDGEIGESPVTDRDRETTTRDRTGDSQSSIPANMTTEQTTLPPIVSGLYPNTQLAYNKITVEDETLGSSDGSHEQSFACSHAPVIDIDLWVDALDSMSAGERRRLLDERPADVNREYDSRGELKAFWVRWSAVDDFLESGPQDRHYGINRTLGTVQFGDGDNGKIPPSGQDNIKATYTTGGGSDGNVGPWTITDLKSSIALVDTVTNPTAANGGTDVESTDTLVSRSTNRFRHRGRAVTPRDYEQVAKGEFPELARVSCVTDAENCITVYIVPDAQREKPVPSMELKHNVRQTLYDRAPATLVSDTDRDIVVRGPGYSELSVQATVRASGVKSVSLLKSTIEERLDEFLHPLAGNSGHGWAFGTLPSRESLVDVVTSVDAVEGVSNFDATITLNDERRSITDQQRVETLPKNTLVCRGPHELSVTMTED